MDDKKIGTFMKRAPGARARMSLVDCTKSVKVKGYLVELDFLQVISSLVYLVLGLQRIRHEPVIYMIDCGNSKHFSLYFLICDIDKSE